MATINTQIKQYLSQNGRSTTGQMASALGYETREVRKACKEMAAKGQIKGKKSKRIPAYIINGEYVVVTEDKSHLLGLVKKHQPSAHSRAKKMSVDQLLKFISNNVADKQVGGPKIYEFWV